MKIHEKLRTESESVDMSLYLDEIMILQQATSFDLGSD